MNFYLFIPFAIILILLFPIKMKVNFSFNLLEFGGAIGVFFYFIKVFHEQFWIKHKRLVTKKDNHIECKEMEFDSDEVLFAETFFKQLVDKIHFKEAFVFYSLGLNDAFLTSMVAGEINKYLYIFFAGIKNQKPTASVRVFDTIFYNKTICQFCVRAVFSISLIDVVYSLINSVILSKKLKKKKRKLKQLKKEKV